MESTKTVMSQLGAPTLRPTSLKTRVSNFIECFGLCQSFYHLMVI